MPRTIASIWMSKEQSATHKRIEAPWPHSISKSMHSRSQSNHKGIDILRCNCKRQQSKHKSKSSDKISNHSTSPRCNVQVRAQPKAARTNTMHNQETSKSAQAMAMHARYRGNTQTQQSISKAGTKPLTSNKQDQHNKGTHSLNIQSQAIFRTSRPAPDGHSITPHMHSGCTTSRHTWEQHTTQTQPKNKGKATPKLCMHVYMCVCCVCCVCVCHAFT